MYPEENFPKIKKKSYLLAEIMQDKLVASVRNEMVGLDSRIAIILIRRFHDGDFPVNIREFLYQSFQSFFRKVY